MKKIHLLTAAVGLVLALASPSLAAQPTQGTSGYNDVSSVRTYGDLDPRNPPNGRRAGHEAYGRANANDFYQQSPYRNAPYTESYGGPNGW